MAKQTPSKPWLGKAHNVLTQVLVPLLPDMGRPVLVTCRLLQPALLLPEPALKVWCWGEPSTPVLFSLCPYSTGGSGLVWGRPWLSWTGTACGRSPSRQSHRPGLEDVAQWPTGAPGYLQNVSRPSSSLHCPLRVLVFWDGCELRVPLASSENAENTLSKQWPFCFTASPRTPGPEDGTAGSRGKFVFLAEALKVPPFLLFWMGLVLGMLAFLLGAKRDSRRQRHQREQSSRFEFYKQFG